MGAKRDAISAAQEVLSKIDPSIVIDGIWGPQTHRAFTSASLDDQSRVRSALVLAGLTPESIREYQRVNTHQVDEVKLSDVQRYLPRADAEQIVEEEAKRLGMGAHTGALKDFLRREARSVRHNGQVLYDVQSRNRSSRGLMQMQPAAWKDSNKTDPTLGAYNPYDARKNIAAGIAYAKRNMRAIINAGYPVNSDTLYLAHNQGAGFFSMGARTNVEGQSAEVRALIARYS